MVGQQWLRLAGNGSAQHRGTPTINGDRLYHENAQDDLVCLDAKTGRKIWEVNLASRFQGRKDGYGRAESVLINGDRVICCPGGVTAMAALDKNRPDGLELGRWRGFGRLCLAHSGGVRGITDGFHDGLQVPDLRQRGQRRVALAIRALYPRCVANCVTPIYHDGHVFLSGGYGLGSALLKIGIKAGKSSAVPVWRSKDLDNRHGGVVLVDGYLYGSAHFSNNAKWICLDWKTGRKMYADRGVGEGSLTCAGGMLYTMSERGAVGLVKPTPSGFRLVSRFKLPEGGEGPADHPVVCSGRLYLRHADRLYAYDVRAIQ